MIDGCVLMVWLYTCSSTGHDCSLIDTSVTNHVWRGKVTHHKWILATLDSFDHLWKKRLVIFSLSLSLLCVLTHRLAHSICVHFWLEVIGWYLGGGDH